MYIPEHAFCKLWMFFLKALHYMVLCLYGVYRPTREFFTHLETSPLPMRAANFDLCSALMAIAQWAFFAGHTYCDTRTHDSHTCCRAFGSEAFTTCFYDLGLSRSGIEPRSPAGEANALPLRLYATTAIPSLHVPANYKWSHSCFCILWRIKHFTNIFKIDHAFTNVKWYSCW